MNKLLYDFDIRSYESFFDDSWKLEMGKLTKGTVLEDAVVALLVNWEATANTHQMPHVLIQGLEGARKIGLSSDSGAMGRLLTFADTLTKRIFAEIKSFSPAQKAQLDRVIKRIATKTRAEAEASAEKPSELWSDMMREKRLKGLHLSLWGSQRLCYPALYFAFEVYARSVIAILAKVPESKIDYLADMKKAAAPILTAATIDGILDDTVDDARSVRNALVHDGGRDSPKLQKRNLAILVEDGYLQIRPIDTKTLFNALKDRALELTKAAIPHLP